MFSSTILASLNLKTVKTLKLSTSLLIYIYIYEFCEIIKLTNYTPLAHNNTFINETKQDYMNSSS